MTLYPIMINLDAREVLVVGGGTVALRKVTDLLDTGAHVRVISPEIDAGLRGLAEKNIDKMELVEREYRDGDIGDAVLVFSATDNSDVNRAVFEDSEKRKVFINAADDPDNCTFYIPSFIRRGDLILSLTTSGSSPAMAARLRREFERKLPDGIEDHLKTLDIARNILKTDKNFSSLDSSERGMLLKKIVNDDNLIKKLTILERNEKQITDFLLEIMNE